MQRKIDIQMIIHAVQILLPVVHRTPLIESTSIVPGQRVFLKAENLQRTHAFKIRGAYNRVHHLTEGERAAGLITASSGNHALGLSLAGQLWEAAVIVVMPHTAPQTKEAGCVAMGARVIRHGTSYDEASQWARELAKEEGFTYVESFDDPFICAGQASVMWEILEERPNVDLVVAPIGGGGLMTGLLSLLTLLPNPVARQLFPERKKSLSDIRVIGVEACGADSLRHSMNRGEACSLPSMHTRADGIAVQRPGNFTFAFLREHLKALKVVSDAQMNQALRHLLYQEKLLVELAGAASVAAVMSEDLSSEIASQRLSTVCILSGGNIDPILLQSILCGEG